nr:hypothetical protein [Pantoea soli]
MGLNYGLNLDQYAPNPLNWIDPLRLHRKFYDENEPNWTPHGYKHVIPKNST